jgi:CRP/FNR family cyclic AMP-dependent transcriptional regulator
MELIYEAGDIICREGEISSDLYLLKEGKVLICTIKGTQVKAIGRISPGEFIGELSFFDGNPRASTIVALEKSVLYQVKSDEIRERLPFWFIEVGKSLTKKIRLLDKIINTSHLRKGGTDEQKPLSIEEQRQILAKLNHKNIE